VDNRQDEEKKSKFVYQPPSPTLSDVSVFDINLIHALRTRYFEVSAKLFYINEHFRVEKIIFVLQPT
jgi:hypothetical protein